MFLFVECPEVVWYWVIVIFGAVLFLPLMICFWLDVLDDWYKYSFGEKVASVAFVWGLFYLLPIAILLAITIPASIQSEKAHNEYIASEYHEIYYDKIYSLNRENEVYGKFRLGSGTVNNETYYYFYIKVAEDTYQLTKIKIDHNDVYIVETTGTNYYVTKNKDLGHEEGYWQIVVPKGTVIEQYSV